MNRRTKTGLIAGALAATVFLCADACAGLSAFGEELNRSLKGVPATWTSYDQSGHKIDEIHGQSFRVSRDERFDSTDVSSDGSVSTVPGEVLLVSIGDKHFSHVGSSACLAQDGITKVADGTNLNVNNTQPGHPFINDFFEKNRNLWQGRAKTIIIRSQDGLPIAIYAGDHVEVFKTDVPKSTWFRVDGKYLWCYRVDYTVPDTALIQ